VSGRALYVPEGCAHGFQTLVDDTDVTYMISTPYAPDASAGVRWDDPLLAIDWPKVEGERTISERDRALPGYEPEPD
jgi:dTDP-4-dehydrorhamnose 3,5-epimerase